MAKYKVIYNITCSHEVEIEADSAAEAKMKVRPDYFHYEDVIQDFADSFPRDITEADVEVQSIFDEDGNYIY